MTNEQLHTLRSSLECIAKHAKEAAAALESKPEHTIESIYGKPLAELTPPNGWEFSKVDGKEEFRAIRAGETFLTVGDESAEMFHCGYSSKHPRLILRQKPKPRRWVFEETGEKRPGNKGDWVQWTENAIIELNWHTTAAYSILRLVEKPE